MFRVRTDFECITLGFGQQGEIDALEDKLLVARALRTISPDCLPPAWPADPPTGMWGLSQEDELAEWQRQAERVAVFNLRFWDVLHTPCGPWFGHWLLMYSQYPIGGEAADSQTFWQAGVKGAQTLLPGERFDAVWIAEMGRAVDRAEKVHRYWAVIKPEVGVSMGSSAAALGLDPALLDWSTPGAAFQVACKLIQDVGAGRIIEPEGSEQRESPIRAPIGVLLMLVGTLLKPVSWGCIIE